MKAKGDIKRCSKCTKDKHISNFFKNRNESDGLQTQCKDCVSLSRNNKKPYQGTLLEFNKTKIKSIIYDDGKKLCLECEIPKEIGEFHYYKSTNSISPECKNCKNLKSKLKIYNITKEEYYRILKESDEKCAICGEPETNGRFLSIDHNHLNGKVRGFLCQKHNIGIGHFNDNVVLLEKAIEYLKKNS